MDKPRAFIHYRPSYSSRFNNTTPGALVIGRKAIPNPVLWALIGITVLVLVVFAAITGSFLGWLVAFLPLIALVGAVALTLIVMVLTMFVRWVVQEIEYASE